MSLHKKILLSSLIVSSLSFIASLVLTTQPAQTVTGAITLPGYVKHCPVMLLYEINGESTYMTQNCETGGSDFITAGSHVVAGGCIECGWPEDCPDPIYVPAYDPGDGGDTINNPPPGDDTGSGSDGSDADSGTTDGGTESDPPSYEEPVDGASDPNDSYDDGSYDDPYYYEESYDGYYDDPYYYDEYYTYQEPTTSLDVVAVAQSEPSIPMPSGRHFVVTPQGQYIAPRFGEQGASREESGRLNLKSDFVHHTRESDFVAVVESTGGGKFYFRMFELELETKTAEKKFVRFGQELDPALAPQLQDVREARIVSSIEGQTHKLKLLGQSDRIFTITSVNTID